MKKLDLERFLMSTLYAVPLIFVTWHTQHDTFTQFDTFQARSDILGNTIFRNDYILNFFQNFCFRDLDKHHSCITAGYSVDASPRICEVWREYPRYLRKLMSVQTSDRVTRIVRMRSGWATTRETGSPLHRVCEESNGTGTMVYALPRTLRHSDVFENFKSALKTSFFRNHFS